MEGGVDNNNIEEVRCLLFVFSYYLEYNTKETCRNGTDHVNKLPLLC